MSARGIYRRRTDWFRVLVELQYQGITHKRVADVLGVGMSTVLGWKAGSEPNHHDGHRLLEMWCEQFNRALSDRPMTEPDTNVRATGPRGLTLVFSGDECRDSAPNKPRQSPAQSRPIRARSNDE